MLESTDPKIEFVNYYGNTSLFALEAIQRHGQLNKMNLLSFACLMPHLADYLALFQSVHHVTMTATRLPIPIEKSPARLHLHQKDIFTLDPLDVDCVISHAAIHCVTDTRYGNVHAPDKLPRPYQFPAKLRQIVGPKQLPVIVSIAVNKEEGFFDNNTHLAHDKFIASFEQSGFALKDYFFDYICGGIPHRPDYFNPEFRRSKTLPEFNESPKHWVVGNYHFH